MGYDAAWRRYIDMYQGLHYDAESGSDQLVVNMTFSTVNVMLPAVAIHNPRFVVNARRPEAVSQAIITEEVLNYLWQTHQYMEEFRLAVVDWLMTGHGWLKVGYKFVKEPETTKVDAGDTNAAGSTSEGADEGVDDRDDVEGNVESEMHVESDRPFVERISIFDMFVDPDARHPKEMRWIAQRTWRAVQDVHADSRYSATNRKRVSGSRWSRWDGVDSDSRDGDDKPDQGAVQYCEIIEFYDLKRQTVGTFAADAGGNDDVPGWLIKPKKIPYGSGHPFVMMRNHEVPDHFYPIGDIAQIESLQSELDETRTQLFNFRKKFRRGWLYDEAAFDQEGLDALESDEDNVLAPVKQGVNPKDALAEIPASIAPAEFYNQSAMIKDDMNEVSGVSEYMRGNPQENIRRTATEAGMIQDASNARAQDRLQKVENVLAELGKRVISLMQQYMTGEQVARVVTLPVRGWINYDRDYISGEFDYEVRGGSTEPRNESFRRQSAIQLVDASIPFLEAGVADPAALYMKVLRDGFGEKDAQRYILPPAGAPPSPEGAPPPGAAPPGMPGEVPPDLAGMPGGLPPEMAAGATSPVELTPEILAMMLAAERGVPPDSVSPDMMSTPPPMM